MSAIKRARTTFFIQNKKVSTFSLTFLWGYLLYMVSGESAVDILLITVGRRGVVALKYVEKKGGLVVVVSSGEAVCF
jgi:hypothetical protein